MEDTGVPLTTIEKEFGSDVGFLVDGVTANAYDGQSNLISTVMPEGNYVTYSYDNLYDPLSITQTPKPGSSLSPRVQSLTYTLPVASLPNFEEVQKTTDPNGNSTTYTYTSDGTGNLSKIDQPPVPKPGSSGNLVPEQVFTYTSIGLLQSSQDAEGRVTHYDYYTGNADQVQKLTVDYNNFKLITQYNYDSYGNVNSITDANNHTTGRTFDALRRLTELDGAVAGTVTEYTYYPDGQVCSVSRQVTAGATAPACNGTTTPNWETTQYTYTLSDKVHVATDPLGNTTTTTYDVDDRVQTVTQQVTATQNRQRTSSYDPLSRLYQLTDSTNSPSTVLETHSYTLNGRDATFIDANNNVMAYVYDGFDRLDHTTYPDHGTESYQYDANGNALQKTTRSGLTIGFSYDGLNRVYTKTPQNEAAGQVVYGYDLTGRLLQASDSSSTTAYEVGYDTAGRATSYTDQQGRNTQVQYDGVGNRTRLQWPAGTNGSGAYYVTYQYDAMNRMTDILESGSTSLAHYTWDALSRQSSISYGDGSTDAYTGYDAGDNLQTLTQTFPGGSSSVTFSYGWQKDHQRASTGVSNGAFQFVPNTGTTTYGAPDANNGYTGVSSASGSASFTYDNNRNLAFDGYNSMAYDVENRLVQAVNSVASAVYWYDPLGARKQKQVEMAGGNTITQFLVAGGEEIADYQGIGVGTAMTLTVRGPGGLPVAAVTPATSSQAEAVVFYHHDVMGSTVASSVPGLSGAAEAYVYSDYGVPVSGSYLSYQFAGYRYDYETGLYYVGARYHSPVLGRFLQTDPIGTAGGNNLYAYVGNDPINLLDPTGLSASETRNDSGNGSSTSVSSYSIFTASMTSSAPATWLGSVIGQAIDPIGGGVVGAMLGSTIGIGGTVTYVPQTSSFYIGGTAQFTPMPMGGDSINISETAVTNRQDADVSGLSYSGSMQPLPIAGLVVTYTPASSTWTMGASQGTRFPDSIAVNYSLDITSEINAVHNAVSSTVNSVKHWIH